MSSQALRSACSRARPELERVGLPLRNYFRQFSTTQSQFDDAAPTVASDAGAGARPTARERTRAAASEINSLVKNRNASVGQRATPVEGAGQPKVIDVRSLPRGLGRGGFRGRGGFAGGAQGAPRTASPGGNRFSPGNRGGASRGGFVGRARGRGGRGGGGGGGQRGGSKTGKARGGGEGDKSAAGPRGKKQDPFERMDSAEKAFDDAMRFGTKMRYNPLLTMDSLAAFMPATPTTKEGQTATVLQNLSVLGTADQVGVPEGLQARNYAEEVERNGVRFFADLKAKEAAEQYLQDKKKKNESAAEGGEAIAAEGADAGPIIRSAEEAIKRVILDNAVAGKHEEPRFALDPVGVARSWHLRAETYTQRDVERFEKKLASLLGKGGGSKGQQPQAKT
ncbi:hypothetical protein PT974_06240 [Cladobotryum mycophilum]|uniref:Uncharacterized protein n=1 Tax=Cladobotryum mycophilum TaxID=491253 RepID=A0ABR0SM46_9HYPO